MLDDRAILLPLSLRQ